MTVLPHGTVTFLLTDVEGSTVLWEQHAQAMRVALARHDALAEETVRRYQGHLIKPRGEGDSLFIVFSSAGQAVVAALALQTAFHAEPWPSETPLRVRMALHTGEADFRDGDYYGPAVNRCARLRAAGHGGQILLSHSTWQIVCDALPADVGHRDWGLHRLRDLNRAEQIHQVFPANLPANFAALKTLDAIPNNLPLQLTSFLGRENEIHEVKRLLSESRMITLIGSGGCGKTRLSLQIGAEVIEQFPDGVWFVELADLSQPEYVAQAVASALHIPDTGEAELRDSLIGWIQNRSLLLILDNCEHLATPCAHLAERLLRVCPNLRILATSRSPLGVLGEVRWRIPSLSVPFPEALPPIDRLKEYAAVHLFVDRAKNDLASFTLTEKNAVAVAQICQRLDGIPLAIELAAARVSVVTVEKIAGRLKTQFDILENASQGVVPRHQTLEALIDWSYQLLSEEHQTLLRGLCVFAGGCDLQAVAAVCGAEGADEFDMLQPMQALVNASLVIVEEARTEKRYRLLATVRDYCARKMEEAGETEERRNRHLAYYLHLAEEAEPHLFGQEQADWLQRLHLEQDNLRCALDWTMPGDTRLRLAGALWRFWAMRGDLHEGRARLQNALLRSPDSRSRFRAKALNGLGVLLLQQGDYQQARENIEEALLIRKALQDDWGVADSLNNLGHVYRGRGDHAEAEKYYRESLSVCQQIDDQWGIAATLSNLGMLARNQGRNAEALRHFEQSLSLFRALGDQTHVAAVSTNLAVVLKDQGHLDQARTFHQESLKLYREMHNNLYAGYALFNLGEVAREQHDFRTAAKYLIESLELRLKLRDQEGCFLVLSGLGKLASDVERYLLATTLFGLAEALQTQFQYSVPESDLKDCEEALATAKAGLSDAEYQAAWTQGQCLTLEACLALVQRELMTD